MRGENAKEDQRYGGSGLPKCDTAGHERVHDGEDHVDIDR